MSTFVHPYVSVQSSPGDEHSSPADWPSSNLQSGKVGPASLQIEGTQLFRHEKVWSGGKQGVLAHTGSHPEPVSTPHGPIGDRQQPLPAPTGGQKSSVHTAGTAGHAAMVVTHLPAWQEVVEEAQLPSGHGMHGTGGGGQSRSSRHWSYGPQPAP
jgi:hypothetical protein